MIWLTISMCFGSVMILVLQLALRLSRIETDLFLTKKHIMEGLDTINKAALESQRIFKDLGNKITIAGGVSRN